MLLVDNSQIGTLLLWITRRLMIHGY